MSVVVRINYPVSWKQILASHMRKFADKLDGLTSVVINDPKLRGKTTMQKWVYLEDKFYEFEDQPNVKP